MFAGGRRAVLATAFTLSACAELLSLDEYETSASTTSSASASGGAGAGDGGSSNSGGTGLGGAGGTLDCTAPLPDVCGVPGNPPGGSCPPECTGGCEGNTCHRECDNTNKCTGTFTCPAGFHCEVLCEDLGCEGLVVECPMNHRCTVTCNWENSCDGLNVLCKNGPCNLWCVGHAKSCEQVTLSCGCNSCIVGCEETVSIAGYEPSVACGPQCDCTICDVPQ